MGPFRRLASYWTPTIGYGNYEARDVEDIAWESTTIGSKRGFLIGFPAGALCIGLFLAGIGITERYRPSAPTTAGDDAAASQAANHELNALREDNQRLKNQVMAVTASATCPPCQPQAGGKAPGPAQAVARPPRPSKRAVTRASAHPKVSATVPKGQAALPIPSECRQEGDCL